MSWVRKLELRDVIQIGAIFVVVVTGWVTVSNKVSATSDQVEVTKVDIKGLKDRDEAIVSQLRDLQERSNVRLSVIEATVIRIERKMDLGR